MSPSETVGLGVAVFRIAMSALLALATTTVAVAVFEVRFGTMLPALAVAASAMFVPEGVPVFTWSTKVKLAVAFRASVVLSVQVMVPVAPTAGLTQVQPAGGVMDWKFVLGGAVAAAGPLLVTLCV